MDKMQSVLGQAGSVGEDLRHLLHYAVIAVRAAIEKGLPDATFPEGRLVHSPRIKDADMFILGVSDAEKASSNIGWCGTEIHKIISTVDTEITRIKTETERIGIEAWRASGQGWGCEDITVYRRQAQYYMQQVFTYAATLQWSIQRTLWNVEFITECPTHPCDEPGAPGYPSYGSHYGNGGDFDNADTIEILRQGQQAAEKAARDAENEWRAQSERATAADAAMRQEQEKRWAADRTLRETETRALQAEQSRDEAVQQLEDTERRRRELEDRYNELEQRLRQLERDQNDDHDGEPQTGRGRGGSRRRRNLGAAS